MHVRTLCTIMLLLLVGGALAQEPRVVVPDHPAGVAVNGCFRANRTLFGPYRLTFCLERRGTYEVRGGGLNCNGQLNWRASGRDILIDLRRASCGGRRAWEAATIECRSGGLLGQIAGQLRGVPRLATLHCTYFPSVRGVSRRTFSASRV